MQELFMSKLDNIPHDCPICGFTLRDMNDVLSYEDYECCTDCQDKFVFKNLNAWMSGSRPNKKEINDFRYELLNRASYLAK